MFYEFNFFKRDPRRLQPMVDFVLETARSADLSAGSAFGITKALTFLNSLMRCLSWGFEPWTGNMKEEFFAALDNDYAEIRDLLADNLHRLEKLAVRQSACISRERALTRGRPLNPAVARRMPRAAGLRREMPRPVH